MAQFDEQNALTKSRHIDLNMGTFDITIDIQVLIQYPETKHTKHQNPQITQHTARQGTDVMVLFVGIVVIYGYHVSYVLASGIR